MKKYWITNDIAVDKDTERELANNGESADARVRLVTAKDAEGTSHYYLQTNGDPVGLIEGDVEHNRTFCETLGMTPDAIIQIINADADDYDSDWPCEQLREIVEQA